MCWRVMKRLRVRPKRLDVSPLGNMAQRGGLWRELNQQALAGFASATAVSTLAFPDRDLAFLPLSAMVHLSRFAESGFL